MNFIDINWDKDYNKFVEYLYFLQDINYRNFHGKLIKDNVNLIGIRTPKLKEIAKNISKGNVSSFIKNNTHSTYEETLIHGLVLGYIKIEFEELITLLDEFIIYVDNWAINDIVSANLKQFKCNQKEGYELILKYINSSNNWQIRFGLTLLLAHYINDQYIDKILTLTNNINNQEYYVQMANAWLISICYIKYPNKTIKLIKNNKLDDFTHNKAIQKIIESYRVTKEDKMYLRTLKR